MSDQRAGQPPSPVKVYVEVTDTITIPYTTGIQRVVRELVSRLASAEYPDIEIVPIFRPAPQVDYRLLTDPERALLQDHPAGGAAGRRADKFGPLAPLVRVVGDTRAVYRARIASRHLRSILRERRAHGSDLALGQMDPGSVFLDVEGSWFDPEPRDSLLPRLRARGVTVMTVVHDVMPVLFPEWFDKRQIEAFSTWLTAHVENSQVFLTNSRCTAEDLIEFARRSGTDISDRVSQIPLGADFADGEPRPVPLDDSVSKFLLVVGTIEPRKNHRLVLDAFNELKDRYQDLALVLVGKEGWMVDDIVSEIRTHEEFGRRLVWLGGLGDAELLWLYQNAFVAVAPSRYEGLGVPVIEALKHGCPTIASTGGALPEAGRGFTELVDPDAVADLTELIRKHLDDPAYHRERTLLAQSYDPPTWEQTAGAVATAIRSAARVETEG